MAMMRFDDPKTAAFGVVGLLVIIAILILLMS
jgi:hypothetical protein